MELKAGTINRLREGNERAFCEIYYMYYKLIYFIIYSYVHNRETSEDLMQDVFVKMYKNIHSLKDNNKFHSWFIRLTKNTVFNYLRERNHELVLSTDMFNNIPDVSPPKFEFNCILDNFENYVITLHFVYELTFKEISEETGKSMSIVTKAYYKALRKLKDQIERGEI